MDLRAVQSSTGPQLVACAVAATTNAEGLLDDAQILAGADRKARACSLAALAVEECGKAAALAALAMMPDALRPQAPVGRLLGWHQLKQVGGLLIAAVTYSSPGAAAKLAAMDAAELARIFGELEGPADEVDLLKRRGFYVDMDRYGRIDGPSDITEAEVATQLARAVRAVSSASTLLDPAVQARVKNPPAEAVELALALVSALTETRDARTPEAAAKVMLTAVSKLRDRMTAIEAEGAQRRSGLRAWPEKACGRCQLNSRSSRGRDKTRDLPLSPAKPKLFGHVASSRYLSHGGQFRGR
jgi:AbiV family abortive infection protein